MQAAPIMMIPSGQETVNSQRDRQNQSSRTHKFTQRNKPDERERLTSSSVSTPDERPVRDGAAGTKAPNFSSAGANGQPRRRSALFKKLAQTFRQYCAGIVSYFQCRITQGAIEAINGIIQLAS